MKVIDMHCDTIARIYEKKKREGRKESLLKNSFHVDLEKMVKGDYLLQNFAMFVPLTMVENPFETAMEMIDLYYQELKKNQELIMPAFSFEDIVNNQANGKMSALLTIEEGETVKGNLSFVRDFYRLGVRMIALTWNYENQVGSPNLITENGTVRLELRTDKGLTPFGIEMIQEMERLGMIVDVSHLSDGGFWDVMKYTEKPFVASHSDVSAKCNVSRNLKDDMVKALGERGGVCGLNYCHDFLMPAGKEREAEEILEIMAGHVRHMADVGGMEVCALGGDLDGIPGNKAVPDASHVQKLADVLRKKGFHESEIEKIFYKNVLRVYREILK